LVKGPPHAFPGTEVRCRGLNARGHAGCAAVSSQCVVRLLLDNDVDHAVASVLRSLRHDAVAASEVGLGGAVPRAARRAVVDRHGSGRGAPHQRAAPSTTTKERCAARPVPAARVIRCLHRAASRRDRRPARAAHRSRPRRVAVATAVSEVRGQLIEQDPKSYSAKRAVSLWRGRGMRRGPHVIALVRASAIRPEANGSSGSTAPTRLPTVEAAAWSCSSTAPGRRSPR